MLIRTSLVIAIAALCNSPLAAQSCAGGVGGGMDAQGCDCNDAVIGASTGAPTATPAAIVGATDPAWGRGLELYDSGHYAEAMRELRVAAEHGHPLAAEMLALMYRFGASRYGEHVRANATEAARFSALAVSLRGRFNDRPSVDQAAAAP